MTNSRRSLVVALALVVTSCGFIARGPDQALTDAVAAASEVANAASASNARAAADFAAARVAAADTYANYEEAWAAFDSTPLGSPTEVLTRDALSRSAAKGIRAAEAASGAAKAATDSHVALWNAEADFADALGALAADSSDSRVARQAATFASLAHLCREAAAAVPTRDQHLVRLYGAETDEYTAIGRFVRAELAGDYDAAILALADADEAYTRQRTHLAAFDAAHLDFTAITVRFHDALNSVDISTLFPDA